MSIYQISLSFEQHFHPAQVLKKVFTIHTATVTGILTDTINSACEKMSLYSIQLYEMMSNHSYNFQYMYIPTIRHTLRPLFFLYGPCNVINSLTSGKFEWNFRRNFQVFSISLKKAWRANLIDHTAAFKEPLLG